MKNVTKNPKLLGLGFLILAHWLIDTFYVIPPS